MNADDLSAAASARRPLLDLALPLSLSGLCVAVLVHLFVGNRPVGAVAIFCFLAFIVTGRKLFGTRERILLMLAAGLTIAAAVLSDDFFPLVERGFGQAAFLAAFMILLALLREGAATSDAVLAVGRYLTHQPPGRRYLATAAGGHALGIFLNFGALSLLGPLIQRGLREGSGDVERHLQAIREQRQISALARGFSWFIVWSPTSVTQALVATVVVGAEHGRIAAIGAAVAVAVLFAGWLEDRWRGARARAQLVAEGHTPARVVGLAFPRRDFLALSSVCIVLALFTVLVVFATGVATIPALMLAAPLVTGGWLWQQLRGMPDTGRRIHARLTDILAVSAPRGSPEALTLAIAGYCGVVAAGLTDAEALAGLIRLDGAPPLVLYLAAAAIVPLASNAAMPPILTVTFLGSLYAALPEPPGEPTLLATAFALGWALNLTASPFGATSLVLARITGIPATTLSWRWNGLFTIIAYLIVAAALALAAGV